MDNPPENNEHHVNIEVNLPAALGKLQVQLQWLSDMVSVGVTGLRKVDETTPLPGNLQEVLNGDRVAGRE
jgi:hypothetical protein